MIAECEKGLDMGKRAHVKRRRSTRLFLFDARAYGANVYAPT
jgi:hypothetical protein